MKIELAKTETIHFVGIGGIGMSGLANIMKGLGFKIQGSDIKLNKNVDRLRKKKIKVYIGHNKKNVSNSTILVISYAIKHSKSKVLFAKTKNINLIIHGAEEGWRVSRQLAEAKIPVILQPIDNIPNSFNELNIS